MVTQAQIDAWRKAAEAYQAAKKSWDTAWAKKIYSQAATDLWVSGKRANEIYKDPTTARSQSTINVQEPNSPLATKQPRDTTTTSTVNTTANNVETPKVIDTSNIQDVKIWDIVPKFWYETNMAERQARNQDIANALFADNKQFNEEKIKSEITTLAPDVTSWEIMHTVNDIKSKFSQLKRYDDIANMDNASITQGIINWTYSMSDLAQLRESNPEAWAEINTAVTNQMNITTNNAMLDSMNALYWDDKTETAFDTLEALNAQYTAALAATDWEDALKTYQDALNDQELLDNQAALTEKEWRVNELDNQLNDLQRVVEDEFGSNAAKSLISSVVADRWANLIREKNSLMIEMNTLGNQVQNAISNAETNYGLNLQQEQINRDNLIAAYWMDKDVWDKKYAVLQANLNKQEQRELAKLSMLEQMDISSLSDTEIDWLGTENRVKDLLKFKKWIESNMDTKYNMQLVDGKMVFYDDYGNIKDTYNPTTPTDNIRWSEGWWEDWMRTDRHNNPTALMYTTWVANWFQSHWYDVTKWEKFPDSNNYTIDMSNLDDPVKATIDYIDAYTFEYKGQPRWTHTNISEDKRNSMSYPEKEDVVKLMYSREWGSGELFGESSSFSSNTFDQTMEPYFIKALNPAWNKLTTADYKAIWDIWYESKEFMQQAYNYKKSKDAELKPSAERLITQLKELRDWLMTEDGKVDFVNMQNFRLWTPLTDGRDLSNRFKQIISSEWLQNLVALKEQWATFGALSDNELNFIVAMATHLDKWSTKEDFFNNLDQEIRTLEKGINTSFTNSNSNADTWYNPFDNNDFIK